MFAWSVPIALVAFVLTWFLRENLLRATSGATDLGEGLGGALLDGWRPGDHPEPAALLRGLAEDSLGDAGDGDLLAAGRPPRTS